MKLSNNEFREILVRAQAGDNEAMTDILEMYMPLINKHSFVLCRFKNFENCFVGVCGFITYPSSSVNT